MRPVKRIELISDEVEKQKVLDGLKKIGVSEYSVIHNVSDDLAMTGIGGNVHVIFFCPQEKVDGIVAEIRPILNMFGGACYISDAMEIRSVRCVASL
jgi:nitrogen regulatory protein PII